MNTKKRYLLPVLLLSAFSSRADVYSKSYLTIRPRFELNFPERLVMFRNDQKDAREGGRGGAFESVLFFGRTVKPTEIAKYFLPNGKDYITIGEDASQSSVNRTMDVNAFSLGILTDDVLSSQAAIDAAIYDGFTGLTFESRLSFCPQQRVLGLGLAFQHRLPNQFWWDIAAPIIQVKNSLGVKECILNNGGNGNPDVPNGYFANALCALGDCNTDRHYGRIVSRCMKKTCLSHIELRVGRDISKDDNSLFGAFLGAYMPTGNKPCAYYLFEPVVGNNHHWAMMLGGYGMMELARDDKDRCLTTIYNAMTRFFIPNHQRRSFDLIGKPWSRYLKVWKSDNNGAALAVADLESNIDYLINYSTLCVKVKPHYSYDFNIAFNYRDRGFQAEVGYNLYAIKAEEVCFDRPMNGETGLMALRYYLDDNTAPRTYQGSTIDNVVFKIDSANYVDEVINADGPNTARAYLPININSLDPNSGASPAAISQTVYGSLGYQWKEVAFPCFINGGLSYEFTTDNTSVQRWTAWFKFGFSI